MLLALSLFGKHLFKSAVRSAFQLDSITGSGTIFCGMAPSMNALIAARAVAGMGGGGYAFLSLSLSFYIYHPAF